MNDLAVIEHQPSRSLTVGEVRTHVNLIQNVMQAVMKPKVHYDTIPGTDKPSLLKAGAEVLMTTFRIAVDPISEDLSTEDEIRYRVRCVGTHQTSGTVMGTGIGECSSNEEKYKWRRAVCDEEFDDTQPDRRRVKYARGKNNSHYTIKQIRTEPSDVANTVLKMAKKRALVDFTLTALAASDIFSQDVEDLPPELRETATEEKREVSQPKAKSASKDPVDPNKKLNEAQLTAVRKGMGNAGIDAAVICQEMGTETLEAIPFARFLDVMKMLGGKNPDAAE